MKYQLRYQLFNYLILTLATSSAITVLNNKAIALNQVSPALRQLSQNSGWCVTQRQLYCVENQPKSYSTLRVKYVSRVSSILHPNKTLLARRIICDPMCREVSRSDSFYIISPVGTLLDSNLPKFSWTNIPKATSYIVRLSSSEGTLWQAETTNTEITYPENQPALQAGKAYDLTVKAIGAEERETETRFIILTPQEAQKVNSEVVNIRKQNLAPEDTALKIAELYEKNNLISLAEKNYQQALNIAESKGDLNGQAWARVKLARINLALDNYKKAIILLKTAHVNYEALNNKELSSQVAQFLGEVYDSLNEKQKSITWYQRAKTGYQQLNDKKRLEWVERQLNRLR
ncbi:MAG: tetratricopeptide repeat protein [Rivularia sp. (in: Bacteria)]|nr:tetratricopeptide repeat protein [Rivularia sp. MS3]